jgi:EAL domain-containing protein (putative c-di-GMP-specific phosphodiesterase class I)
VTVALAPSQLLDAELPRHVRGALAQSGLEGRALILSVSESLAARNTDRTLRGLHELKELGVRVRVDGFGRGGCSLGALRDLPADLLGIDPSFVRGLGEDEADETAVEAVLALARALRLLVVAAGVTTEAQADALEALGCRRASGPFFGEAFPAARAGALLERPGVLLGPN